VRGFINVLAKRFLKANALERVMKKKSVGTGSALLRFLGFIAVLGFTVFLVYSVYTYRSSVEQIEEFEVCYEDRCIKTFHIHADIAVHICGEKTLFPLEHGPLEGPHTHKERNYIHFHERLPYDPVTHRLLNDAPLKVGAFLTEMDLPFSSRCIGKYCNDDLCSDEKAGIVRMMVNGAPQLEFDQYAWKDGDDIVITFE